MKYLYRVGLKEGQSTERDEGKAEWYHAMYWHAYDPENNPDPRKGR